MTLSHNDTICTIDFSGDILFKFSFNFKNSNKVKLSCMVVDIEPSTLDPSINQLSKCCNVFLPSTIEEK